MQRSLNSSANTSNMGQFTRPLLMRPLHTAAGRINHLVRTALTHPLGLLLLAAGAAAAAVLQNFPGLEPWSGGAIRLLLWAGAGYLVVAALVLYWQSEPPQLRQLRNIRDRMVRRVSQRGGIQTNPESTGLTRVCRDALAYLENEIEPELRKLLRRHKELEDELRPYQRGQVRPPSADLLRQLESRYAGQQEAIDGCLQQVSDMDAALIGLLQEADDTRVVENAKAWADELRSLHQILEEALHGAPEQDDEEKEGTEPELVPPPIRLVEPTDWTEMTHKALQALRRRSALAQCELLERVPRSIDAKLRKSGQDPTIATSLERTQALSELLDVAIERLKAPGARPGTQEAMQYQIIHEQYVKAMPAVGIWMRLGLAERTYHHYRSDAVEIIALELQQQEAMLSRNGTGHAPDRQTVRRN